MKSHPFVMNAKRFLYFALLTAALAIAVLHAVDSFRSHEHDTSVSNNNPAAFFRIFRTPIEIPSQTEAQSLSALAESNGLAEVANTQVAVTDQGRLWVFRTARQVCIRHMRGIACAPWRKATREGVILGVFDPPDMDDRNLHNFLVQGIAPDGVSQVQVRIGHGRDLIVDVEENVFSIAADKPIHLKRLLRN